MKLRHTALALATLLALGSQAAWADEAAAKRWIDSEFHPSTLTKEQQAAEMKWFIDAAAKLKAKGVRVLDSPSTFTEGPAAGLTWVYFLAPWGLQLELVSAPNGMAHEKTLQRKLWDPRFPAS